MVVPLLLIIVFGIIEMSMALRDYAVVASNTRVGARIASTGAGAGQCNGTVPVPQCSSAASPILAQMAANAIQRAGSAMPRDNIEYIMVYKANDAGFPGSATTMPTTCPANCVKYTWVDADNKFRFSSGSWTGSTINACFPANLERVGVFLQARHPFVTGLFGASVPLADRTIQEFEPLAANACRSGDHP